MLLFFYYYLFLGTFAIIEVNLIWESTLFGRKWEWIFKDLFLHFSRWTCQTFCDRCIFLSVLSFRYVECPIISYAFMYTAVPASLTQWQQIFFFKSSVISPNKQSQNANLSRFLLKFNLVCLKNFFREIQARLDSAYIILKIIFRKSYDISSIPIVIVKFKCTRKIY
jgi:hypothetical protein